MDFVSLVELGAAVVTILVPVLAQLSNILDAHLSLAAKVESIATELETHKADLETIQADLEALKTSAVH